MSHELVPQPEPERLPDRMEAGDSGDPAGHSDASGGPRPERYIFTPPIDIYESDEGLVLHADLPGVSLETLELQVQDNKLTLFGRVKPAVPPGATILHQEYELGDFLRSFILSDEVDHERITATLNNGVLKVLLPKAQRPEPRRIQVSTD